MGTKDELEAAKLERELVKLRLAAWSDYIGFATSKVTAVASIVCGGLDIVSPSLIPHIPQPHYLLGGRLAIRTPSWGKTVRLMSGRCDVAFWNCAVY